MTTSTRRPGKYDQRMTLSIRGIETRHADIEAAQDHYMIEAEGALAVVTFFDGTTEDWRY